MVSRRRSTAWSKLTLRFSLFVLLAMTLYPTMSSAAGGTTTLHLVINEVELNPPGSDGSAGSEEWVELYNPTDQDIDVSDWTFSTTGGHTTITQMKLRGFIAEREGAIVSEPLVKAGGYLALYLKDRQWLDNFEERVLLQDAAGREVDRTPLLSDSKDDERSWQRIPNGQDTDTDVDWRFRQSTRGAPNQ